MVDLSIKVLQIVRPYLPYRTGGTIDEKDIKTKLVELEAQLNSNEKYGWREDPVKRSKRENIQNEWERLMCLAHVDVYDRLVTMLATKKYYSIHDIVKSEVDDTEPKAVSVPDCIYEWKEKKYRHFIKSGDVKYMLPENYEPLFRRAKHAATQLQVNALYRFFTKKFQEECNELKDQQKYVPTRQWTCKLQTEYESYGQHSVAVLVFAPTRQLAQYELVRWVLQEKKQEIEDVQDDNTTETWEFETVNQSFLLEQLLDLSIIKPVDTSSQKVVVMSSFHYSE